MIQEKLDSDTSKELLMLLSYCNNNIISKIPDNIIQKLTSLAADSNKDYYIDETKSLSEQNISEECKDLLSLLYCMYVEEDKDNILNTWINNEKGDKNE